MTLGNVSAPSWLASRRRLAMLVPLALGLVVGAVLWFAAARNRTPQPPAVVEVEHSCTYDIPPDPVPPPPPLAPPRDAWSQLERCLREGPFSMEKGLRIVTVADVRHWVEVEHDPVWFEGGKWWLPLSGEGDPQMPSGLYLAVPLEASAPCGGAIVN